MTARARTKRKATSPACVGPRWAFTIISAAGISAPKQRNGVAGEQPPPVEWRPLEPDNRRRPGSPQERDMGRLLASEGSMTEPGNDHAVSRLISKRAELAGMIAHLEQELDQCRADLTHIDGALRVLRSDLDPTTIPPRRPYTRPQ